MDVPLEVDEPRDCPLIIKRTGDSQNRSWKWGQKNSYLTSDVIASFDSQNSMGSGALLRFKISVKLLSQHSGTVKPEMELASLGGGLFYS